MTVGEVYLTNVTMLAGGKGVLSLPGKGADEFLAVRIRIENTAEVSSTLEIDVETVTINSDEEYDLVAETLVKVGEEPSLAWFINSVLREGSGTLTLADGGSATRTLFRREDGARLFTIGMSKNSIADLHLAFDLPPGTRHLELQWLSLQVIDLGEVSIPIPALSAPTPEATMGAVQGELIGAESQQPLKGAAVVLCLVVGEKTCVLQADLVSISGEDGKFELTEVPPGSYIVFYDSSGKASSSWKEIDGLEMILKLEGLSGFPSTARTELFSTFGGGGAITYQKGTRIEFEAGGVVGGDGSIISEKYGLTMDFHGGKPITIEIQLGKITELEINAWAQ